MRVILDKNQIDKSIKRAVALGNFDGIHIGHQRLIEVLLEKSRSTKQEASVYTFKSHPFALIASFKAPPIITSNEMKIKIFETCGIDSLIFADFDTELMSLSPEDFVKNILVDTLNCSLAVVGFDYRFGHKAQGDVELLIELGRKYGIEVHEIASIAIDGEKVSSTGVRKYISNGNVERAREFLGRYFSILGQVKHGHSRGKMLGFPTANLYVEEGILLPKAGVYSTLVTVGDATYMGATCVGTNPTFEGDRISVETFIIDFEGCLYDNFIEIHFVKHLRDQIKFSTIEELVNQMSIDVEETKIHLQEIVNVLK